MWTIRIEARAAKDLSAFSRKDQTRVLKFLETRLASRRNPRELGQALAGPLSGQWKYRVGDFRVIATIDDRQVTILVIRVGNRRDVYR